MSFANKISEDKDAELDRLIRDQPTIEGRRALQEFVDNLKSLKSSGTFNATSAVMNMMQNLQTRRAKTTSAGQQPHQQQRERFGARFANAQKLRLKGRPFSTSDSLKDFQPQQECVFITNRVAGQTVQKPGSLSGAAFESSIVISNPSAITDRTISWCILDPRVQNPEQAQCVLNFCFDVDEVRDYIEQNSVDESVTTIKAAEQACAFGNGSSKDLGREVQKEAPKQEEAGEEEEAQSEEQEQEEAESEPESEEEDFRRLGNKSFGPSATPEQKGGAGGPRMLLRRFLLFLLRAKFVACSGLVRFKPH